MTNTRFEPLNLNQMSAAQRAVAERSLAGPRKKLGPPFNVLLQSADVADHAERLGEYVRYRSVLPHRVVELVTLIVARHWRAHYVWSVHCPWALEAGISARTLSELAAEQRPSDLSPGDTQIYDFCKNFLDRKEIDDELFDAVVKQYEKQGVVDLIGLMGSYFINSMALVIDRYPPPPGGVPWPPSTG